MCTAIALRSGQSFSPLTTPEVSGSSPSPGMPLAIPIIREALDVAGDQHVERTPGVDLDEARDTRPGLVADLAVGRDRRYDRHYAVLREQAGDEGDAPDVGVAIRLAEAEAVTEVPPDRVAVD